MGFSSSAIKQVPGIFSLKKLSFGLRRTCLELPKLKTPQKKEVVESFYGGPPNFYLTKIAGFETTPRAVPPEIRRPLPPRRHRSIVLREQENIWFTMFIASLLVLSSCETVVKEIAGFGGGLSWNQSVHLYEWRGSLTQKSSEVSLCLWNCLWHDGAP